jgi:hypothetical protein
VSNAKVIFCLKSSEHRRNLHVGFYQNNQPKPAASESGMARFPNSSELQKTAINPKEPKLQILRQMMLKIFQGNTFPI